MFTNALSQQKQNNYIIYIIKPHYTGTKLLIIDFSHYTIDIIVVLYVQKKRLQYQNLKLTKQQIKILFQLTNKHKTKQNKINQNKLKSKN